jgi:site-specific recombinase XerD
MSNILTGGCYTLEKVNKTTYHDELNKKNITHLREILDTLPAFCGQYFRGTQDYISTRTRVAYAYDIRVFFEYLHENNPIFKKTPITEYKIEILDKITRMDIEEYLDHCTYYSKDGKEYMNDERGKSRKLASLRSFYNYFFQNEMIETNPAVLVKMPKLHE